MIQEKYRRREQTIKILKIVATGTLLISIGAIPPPWAVGRILRELTLPDTTENRRHARRKWSEIKKRGYVRTRGHSYALSEKAEKMLTEAKLWNLKIPIQKEWDHCWHLVLFDIPVDKNRSRIAFDGMLRNLGLIMYQRSVWIFPYPCRGTIERVARYYGISKYISYATAIALDGQTSLMRHFRLK